MISSTRTLPDGYRQTGEIDLSKNKGLAILLSLAALIFFFPSLALAGAFVRWARPELTTGSYSLGIVGVFALFASVAVNVLVHEWIHGLLFWAFTRSRPVFALRLQYAYAAAPDWFIPTRQYWIIGLAPLVLIGAMGLLLIFIVPAGWVPLLVFWVAVNTAGSVGDLFIVARLLRLSPGSLVQDAGDRVGFFEPAAVSTPA